MCSITISTVDPDTPSAAPLSVGHGQFQVRQASANPDGSSAPACAGEAVIDGGRITAVGCKAGPARRTVDADGPLGAVSGAFGMNIDFENETAEFAWITRLGKEIGRPIWFFLTDRPTDPKH
jgi:hypothetical protein